MTLSHRLFLVVAVMLAAGCIRLGFWQLDRLDQRRAANARIAARLEAPPVDVWTLSGDTAAIRYRRVTIAGTPDYDRELVLMTRSQGGSPGVHLLTPFRRAGSDTAILVNRGWVYSPDGITVDHGRWRERDTVVTGWVESMVAGRDSSPRERGIRRMQLSEISQKLPYPVRPYYVVAIGDSTPPSQDRVVRLGSPALGEGSHFSYAMQWFGFAAVALVGGAIVTVPRLRSARARTMQQPPSGRRRHEQAIPRSGHRAGGARCRRGGTRG